MYILYASCMDYSCYHQYSSHSCNFTIFYMYFKIYFFEFMHTNTHTHTHAHTCAHTHMHTHTCTCARTHTHTHTHIHTHTRTHAGTRYKYVIKFSLIIVIVREWAAIVGYAQYQREDGEWERKSQPTSQWIDTVHIKKVYNWYTQTLYFN